MYNFSELTDPRTFLNEIKKGKTSLEEAKNMQQNYLNYFKLYEKEIKMLNKKKNLSKY